MAGKITTKQVKVIAALFTEPTTEKAAKKAGVSYRTVARWLAGDPNFQAALSEAESQCITEAARLIAIGAVEAVSHFRETLGDKKTSKTRQDRAAAKLLQHVDKVRLLGSIEQALEEWRQNELITS